MSYTIYRTEGIVVGSAPSGEANRYLQVFTKEFGLVGVSAQGLRELKSKLRYSLQDFSHGHIDLVKGKHGWRAVNIEGIRNYAHEFGPEKHGHLALFLRVVALLKRLLKGEERNEKLFDEITGFCSLLCEHELSSEDLRNLEVLIVMRALYHLGYWGENEIPTPYLHEDLRAQTVLKEVSKIRLAAIREINKSLEATQL